jgi:phosphoribosylanthranilate isomerase
MPIELKICGINSENIIRSIEKIGGCKYLGFVFYSQSPRNISLEQSLKLTSIVSPDIKKVAVLVNPEISFVEKIKNQFDYFQIYDTPPEQLKKIKLLSNKKIIQAIKVKKKEDLNLYKQYIGIADKFLFDSSGMEKSFSFDWNYLKNIQIKDWFLAGGINVDNLEIAQSITKKIDISSGLEDNPGKKSPKKILDFLTKIKSYD